MLKKLVLIRPGDMRPVLFNIDRIDTVAPAEDFPSQSEITMMDDEAIYTVIESTEEINRKIDRIKDESL